MEVHVAHAKNEIQRNEEATGDVEQSLIKHLPHRLFYRRLVLRRHDSEVYYVKAEILRVMIFRALLKEE